MMLRVTSVFMSIAVVFILFVFLVFWEQIKPDSGKQLEVRKIEVALPLPPPPEPPKQIQKQDMHVQQMSFALQSAVDSQGPAMRFERNAKTDLEKMMVVEKPDNKIGKLDLMGALAVDFPVFKVEELDSYPRLISSNRITLPRALRRRGIKNVETVVEIIIDQSGNAFVKSIIDPVYPEMIEVIRKAINHSRFTIPKKEGRPVQAIYVYTLKFIDRT